MSGGQLQFAARTGAGCGVSVVEGEAAAKGEGGHDAVILRRRVRWRVTPVYLFTWAVRYATMMMIQAQGVRKT
jgi:hypothetical protein